MTIAEFAAEVCAKLGQSYSLYTTRATAILPDAIKQVLQSGQFDRSCLYWDEATQCGAKVFSYDIVIGDQRTKDIDLFADKTAENMIVWKDMPIIRFNSVVIDGTRYQVFASPVSKNQIYNTAMYGEFIDDGLRTMYYNIDSHTLIVSNPLTVEATGKAEITAVVITKTWLATTTAVLDNVFGMSLIRSIIEAAVQLLKPEIE